jgi:hypothetical protein
VTKAGHDIRVKANENAEIKIIVGGIGGGFVGDLPPAGALTNYSGCKLLGEGAPSVSGECLRYDWTGQGTLVLKHINAGFNCCPERFSVRWRSRIIRLP